MREAANCVPNTTETRRVRGGGRVRLPVVAAASVAALFLAVLALVTGEAEEAGAAFPGTNGPIAFEAHGSYSGGVGLDVFATDAGGATPTNLTRDLPPGSEERSPAFSADGKRIAYASDSDHLGEDPLSRGSDLYRMNPDGTNKTRLTSDGNVSPYAKPAFSPDGRRVFFAGRDGGLYSVGADGSGRTRLATSASSWGDVDVSPDGRLVLFVADAGSGTGNDGTVHVADAADGTGQRRLVQGAGEETGARFLPDGRVVFSRDLGFGASGADPARFVVNADGSGERRLSGGYGGLSPSPDGTRAVFEGTDGLYVSALDGSGARRIVADTQGAGEISFAHGADWGPSDAAAVPSGVRVESLSTDKATYAPGETVRASVSLSAQSSGTMREVVVATRKAGGAEAPDFPVTQNFAVGPSPKTLTAQRSFTDAGTYDYFVGWFDGTRWNALTPTRQFTVAAPAPAPAPNTAPTITYPKPAPGSTTYDRTPLIQATVKDKETDLYKSNVALYVDGVRIGASYFSYDRATDRLSYQRSALFGRSGHSVRIVATDAKGLSKSYAWSFYVK